MSEGAFGLTDSLRSTLDEAYKVIISASCRPRVPSLDATLNAARCRSLGDSEQNRGFHSETLLMAWEAGLAR